MVVGIVVGVVVVVTRYICGGGGCGDVMNLVGGDD